MGREVRKCEHAGTSVDRQGEVADAGGGPTGRAERERSMPSTSDRSRAVLPVGEAGTGGGSPGAAQRQAGRKKADPTVPLQAEIEKLRTVVAELSAENLQLKKGLWP